MACGDDSCEAGVSLISGAFVNVTGILLVGSVGLEGRDRDYIYDPDGPREKTADAFWFYALDGATGKPLKDAELEVFHGQNGHWTRRHLAVDELGRSKAEATVPLNVNSWANWQADPLLSHAGSWAYWNNPAHLGFSPPPHVQVFVETDRPIYRPGQKVGFKVIVTQRIPQGYKAYAGLSEVRVQALDANYQELYALTKKPGENGTLSGEFLIPSGRMLGLYQIQAHIQKPEPPSRTRPSPWKSTRGPSSRSLRGPRARALRQGRCGGRGGEILFRRAGAQCGRDLHGDA